MKTKYFTLLFLFLSTLVSLSQHKENSKPGKDGSSPLINFFLSEINADSIKANVEALENFGTRFMLASNRKQVAEWIKNKYISYGYTNAVLDSFFVTVNFSGTEYQTWQYNVVATLEGTLSPEVSFILGAHYDSYNQSGDVFTSAPGADDNASGTAAALEIARVMKMKNYQPASRIKFIAFAAEELMLHTPFSNGSYYYANKANQEGAHIKLMINNDMISHARTNVSWVVKVNPYDNAEWLTNFAVKLLGEYTSLSVFINASQNQASDSYSFWQKGFPCVYFEEAQFSLYYHTSDDVSTKYNFDYCAEVAKVSAAILLESNERPVVSEFDLKRNGNAIAISWNELKEGNVAGYNVYRSPSPGNNFVKLNNAILQDTTYLDSTVTPLTTYYYTVVSVNNLYQESMKLDIDSAVLLTRNKGILIVDDSQGEILSPSDSAVDTFYKQLFSQYGTTDYDVYESGDTPIDTLGQYSLVVWHTNKYSLTTKFFSSKNSIRQYLRFGGQMLFFSDRFGFTTEHSFTSYAAFKQGHFLYDIFKIDSIYKAAASRFNGAQSALTGYPDLSIDSAKTIASNLYHLSNIESLYPFDGANKIYSYNTNYDSTTSYGIMKGLTVGVEYMGDDYRVIALSFPLWYVKEAQAQAFVDYIMQHKFDFQNKVLPNRDELINKLYPCFPNPANTNVTMNFSLASGTEICIDLIDITGKKIKTISDKFYSKGFYQLNTDISDMPAGMYFCRINGKGARAVTRLIIVR
ncbi:MAG: hypothetical protein A2275_02530 [Bacteroidetes bacterium RIFOXYA12_FULL_35_11]|nr:MAG: hypothetical protein A2X01_11635 [Bacteroidetes bacterium GWF2_35_48]OFY81161.1 MAG: hypothetical protein A2275_02530 [Bacteroidetes bacterium RIFOXYA12_FULL_35_11]OFY95436.1 MAG: hypothetical protein A2491_02050 [Bacteroidetes bacterium RIFOXYC12_FULL_35_7]OFY96483.1 MAG: hypothetical protein A2309_07270 [Bacteroidetes bacterium RIFOXYB2_FULL_35_7]HBX50973.1 hypothetical protein [Bacteroidales bacterium]